VSDPGTQRERGTKIRSLMGGMMMWFKQESPILHLGRLAKAEKGLFLLTSGFKMEAELAANPHVTTREQRRLAVAARVKALCMNGKA
jgi:hypothetical protein